MPQESSDVLIRLLSSLDAKGFKAAQEEAKKLGLELRRAGRDGTVALNKLEKKQKDLKTTFVENAMKIGMVWTSLKKMVSASIEQHQADVQLRLAIKNNTDEYSRQGKTVAQLTKKLKDYAGAREEATGIDDAATQQQMKLLLSMGVMPDQVERVTEALQDMAAGTGIPVEMMARAWGRLQEAPEEALGALSRAGIRLRKEELESMSVERQRIFILEKLEEKFKGQAKTVFEASGEVGKATVAINNAVEAAGDTIMPAVGAIASVIADLAKAFNGLPRPVQGALMLVAGAVTMYLSGPIGMITGAIVALGGLLSMFRKAPYDINAMKNANASLEKAISDVSGKMTDAQKSTTKLMEQLRGTKQGTSEYENLVREIIALNPSLVNSNINVASSYNEISNAIKSTIDDTSRMKIVEAADEALKNAKPLIEEIIELENYKNPHSAKDDEGRRKHYKFKADSVELKKAFDLLRQAEEITKIRYREKLFEIITEASKLKRYEGFGYTPEQRGMVAATRKFILLNIVKGPPLKNTTPNQTIKKPYTANNRKDEDTYDIEALQRKLKELENLNAYGEKAGALLNRLADAENKYADERKKIEKELAKDAEKRNKALNLALDIRNETIKQIITETEANAQLADVERQLALETDEHNRRKLEIQKNAIEEKKKAIDNERSEEVLLKQKLSKGEINKATYDEEHAKLTKKYADIRVQIEEQTNAKLKKLDADRAAAQEEEYRKNREALELLGRQVDALRNVRLYGKEVGAFMNRLAEINDKYADKLKEIDEKKFKSEDEKKQAIQVAKNMRDEELKTLEAETEKVIEQAKAERGLVEKLDEYAKKKREIRDWEDAEFKKIDENEQKAIRLLDEQYKYREDAQEEHEKKRSEIVQAHSDARVEIEVTAQKKLENLEKEPREKDEDVLELLRRRWETEFNIRSEYKRELFNIEVEYQNELERLANLKTLSVAERKAAQEKLLNIKQKKEQDARYKHEIAIIDAISGYYASAMSIANKNYLDGIQEAMDQIATQTDSAWLKGISTGITIIRGVVNLLKTDTEEFLKKMQKELKNLEKSMDSVGGQSAISMVEKTFGSDSSIYSKETLKMAEEAYRRWRESNPIFAEMTKEELHERYQKLAAADYYRIDWNKYVAMGNLSIFRTNQNKPHTRIDYMNLVAEIQKLFQDMYGDFWNEMMVKWGLTGTNKQIWNKWKKDVKNHLTPLNDTLKESIGKAIEAISTLDNAKTRNAMAKHKEKLADIEHRLKVGEISEEEALKKQLKVYDVMIEQVKSLDNTLEKNVALNKLTEERYTLNQNLLNLQNKEKKGLAELLATEQGRVIQRKMDELEKIQRMIKKGQLGNNMSNAVIQQDLYRQIIFGLKSLKADKSVIKEWEDKLISLVKGQLGKIRFDALSGAGSSVLLPDGGIFDPNEVQYVGQRMLRKVQSQLVSARARAEVSAIESGVRRAMSTVEMPTPTVNLSTETNPTKIQQFHVNMQLPNDLIGYIMREIKRQTGHTAWPSGRG